MSFIPGKEKLMMEKFLKAEEVRKIKKVSHIILDNPGECIREKLEKASIRMRSLEKTLKDISAVRLRRKYLRKVHDSFEKKYQHILLKEKVVKSTKFQLSKLSHNGTATKKLLPELYTPEHIRKNNSIKFSSQSPTTSKTIKTPELTRSKILNFY